MVVRAAEPPGYTSISKSGRRSQPGDPALSRETGRETDSSSSGAQGRGGAAYPSGTPPYGSRQYPSLHPTQDAVEESAAAGPPRSQPQPEEPKTETTLTTRIRINIPGSRPIPPVVVRKTVADTGADPAAPDTSGDGGKAAPAPAPAPAPAARPEPAAPAPAPETAAKAEEKPTSDWFAPRKPAAPSAPSAPATPPAPSGSADPAGPSRSPGPTGPAGMGAGAAVSGAAGAPGGPRTSAPGQPGKPAGGPRGSGFAGPATGGIPTVGGASISATPAGGTPMFLSTPPLDDGTGYGAEAPLPPSGPTTGPMTGPMTGPVPGDGAAGADPYAGNPFASGPHGAPAFAEPPRLSDDTAILTPQGPAPGAPHGPGAPVDGGHVSGDTLSSGIPVVPSGPDPARRSPEGFSAPEVASSGRPAPARPSSATPPPSAPAKKGRSKLPLVAFGVVGLAGLAYGAGLLLNHSDVPKGTTVLGVDIGGGTKEEAVNKLEAALGKRAATPLRLSVDGKKVELAPDKAGLSLDSQETVRGAAGSDYNPVSVISTLFGGKRVAQPVLPVDEEKLSVALKDVAGASGSATEGTITFSPGKATAVEGKPGKGLDIARSMISVKDAYRAQVQTGTPNTVELPVVTRQPTITKAELDRAMNDFAKPAMSGLITIKAGSKEIQFGPAKSLPKILSMKPVDGRLVEVYDKNAIDELLDGVFDGIMITKGDGKKHQVSADDVAFAMREALLGKTQAERTKVIDLDGQG
ncbi:hypothetical protein [Streptomyces sp. NPDC053755]|uniref:hypothetical protein n=1 Tax=Streptomyces sp. NPDC053755 TaxID=3155815 RepID=UPI00341C1C37